MESGKKYVLIAEKNSDWRELYKGELEKAFPDIIIDELTSNLGGDLVERVLSNKYAMAMSNDGMMDCTGIEAVKEIRRAGNKIPIYLITGDGLMEQTAKNAGATGYYDRSKFRMDDLVTELHQYLR